MASVCPNVLRTGFSTPVFYDILDGRGLLVPMSSVVAGIEQFLGDNDDSGRVLLGFRPRL
jgi:hypothetical protein